jgi:predicted SAM-dependent methyltransferase
MRIAHLGCGPIHIRSDKAEWVNVDISEHHNPDVVLDYLKMVDHFGEQSFDAVWSCHSIEHLPWPEGVQTFFQQAKKLLKPGGVMRICVPDLKKVATKYANGEDLKDIYDGPYWTYQDQPATRFMFFCRGWEHTVLFDEQLLRSLAEEVGFTNFKVMPFSVSQIPELSNRDRFATESISVEMTA